MLLKKSTHILNKNHSLKKVPNFLPKVFFSSIKKKSYPACTANKTEYCWSHGPLKFNKNQHYNQNQQCPQSAGRILLCIYFPHQSEITAVCWGFRLRFSIFFLTRCLFPLSTIHYYNTSYLLCNFRQRFQICFLSNLCTSKGQSELYSLYMNSLWIDTSEFSHRNPTFTAYQPILKIINNCSQN